MHFSESDLRESALSRSPFNVGLKDANISGERINADKMLPNSVNYYFLGNLHELIKTKNTNGRCILRDFNRFSQELFFL